MLIDALNEINRITQEIADGNLMVKAEKRSEQDKLMVSLAQMIDNLTQVISSVKDKADNLGISSRP